ncbi:MAG: acyl-CoA dehydrogenase family protein [Micromonosporaceae bacterium]
MRHLDEAILRLPFFAPRHRELAEKIDTWCTKHAALCQGPHPDGPRAQQLAILSTLGADGWLAMLDTSGEAPELRSICLMREALAYAGDLADYAFSIQALSATPIQRHGTDQQRRRYLPGLADGSLVGAFAVSEHNAGSDLAAIALRAERTGDGYRLTGHKAWIANGDIADVICVVARTGEGPGALGLTAFLVPAGTPGFTVAEQVETLAPRAFAQLEFDGCVVGEDAVLGRPGTGFIVAMELLERFRMTVGAAAVGFARRAAEAALAHARGRTIYGGRLFDLPTVKATFADIELKRNAAALLVARAAWEADERGGRTVSKHSSIAKLYATEVAQEIVDASLQLYGAAGLVSGSVTERLYREIRSLRIYEGTSEIQKQIIAGSL